MYFMFKSVFACMSAVHRIETNQDRYWDKYEGDPLLQVLSFFIHKPQTF